MVHARTLLNTLVLAALAAASGTAAAGATRSGWDAVKTTKSYTALAVASDTTINPMRGYYRWQNQELIPQPAPALESYRRYYWRDLETAEGQYNFSSILADLQLARSQGRKFAFRLRMMAGYDDNQLYAPSYLVNNAQCQFGCGFWSDVEAGTPGSTFVPDFNDPYVIARSRALVNALAATLNGGDSIAWIDVGMYGQYGEWALKSASYTNAPAGIVPATLANKREYAKMHFEAFPNYQHVMFIPYSNKDALQYGLFEQTITSMPVGLRVDCLSRDGYFNQWTDRPTEWAQFANQWQKAPMVSEFCPFNGGDPLNNPAKARLQAAQFHVSNFSNANFAINLPDANRWASLSSAEQNDLLMLARESGYRYGVDSTNVTLTNGGLLTFTTTLRNLGTAPTYEPWTVQVEVLNSSGVVRFAAPLNVDLRTMVGGGVTKTVQGSWQLSGLPAGTYSLRLVARDSRAAANPSQARAPLKWVTSTRNTDGSLTVQSLRLR